MDIYLQLGKILSIDRETDTVIVQSYVGGSLLPIKLDNSPSFQHLPKIGSRVLFLRYGQQFSKIIKIWGADERVVRMGSQNLLEGDIQIQSEGRSYILLDLGGNVSLVDGSMLNSIRLDNKMRQVILKGYELIFQTYSNIKIQANKEGELDITKKDKNDEIVSQIKIDKDQNIKIENKKVKIHINSEGEVFIDADKVYLGKDSDDEEKRAFFGDIVTSGPFGTYQFDRVTGSPISGSSTIKAKD